jgi:hypothetical protein
MPARSDRRDVWVRAFAAWLAIIAAEMVHGVLRGVLLAPRVGDFRARQLGVATGCLLILGIAYLLVDWIGARTTALLAAVGTGWAVSTLAFEIGLGRLVLGSSWERLWSDYDVARGGLMPFGLLLMALAPILAARWRRQRSLDSA